MNIILGIVCLVSSIFCFITYHKIFDVVYFDLGKGCLSEIIGCVIAGAFLTALIFTLWYIVAIITAILAVVSFTQQKTSTGVICIIMTLFVSIMGILL